MLNVYLLLYTVLPLSAGVVEMTGMPTPQFSGVSFRFPTEQSCQQAASAINELGSGPITNDDAKAVMNSGVSYSNNSLMLVANCEANDPDKVKAKELNGWQGYEDPKQRTKPVAIFIIDALKGCRIACHLDLHIC